GICGQHHVTSKRASRRSRNAAGTTLAVMEDQVMEIRSWRSGHGDRRWWNALRRSVGTHLGSGRHARRFAWEWPAISTGIGVSVIPRATADYANSFCAAATYSSTPTV